MSSDRHPSPCSALVPDTTACYSRATTYWTNRVYKSIRTYNIDGVPVTMLRMSGEVEDAQRNIQVIDKPDASAELCLTPCRAHHLITISVPKWDCECHDRWRVQVSWNVDANGQQMLNRCSHGQEYRNSRKRSAKAAVDQLIQESLLERIIDQLRHLHNKSGWWTTHVLQVVAERSMRLSRDSQLV